MPCRLGVNVDHVATLRQSRRTLYPDPVAAALLAELAGADQITIHLREDRRHIQERDLQVMRRTVATRLNLEMAATQEMVKIAYETKPDVVTLVPERREELTTEGGLGSRGSGRDESMNSSEPSPITSPNVQETLCWKCLLQFDRKHLAEPLRGRWAEGGRGRDRHRTRDRSASRLRFRSVDRPRTPRRQSRR